MADKHPELRVVRRSSDGRRRYDDKGKRALVEEALRSGVSVARLAQEHGINANLLRKWITKYLLEREKGISPASQDDAAGEQESPHAPEEIVLEGALAVIDGAPIDIPGSRKRSSPVASPTATDAGEDAVFRFDEGLKVYLHREPVDFRYGMNSLSILVEQAMRLNPMDSSLYVFTNRRCDRIKILGWQGNGFWLMLKRLEANDRFVWPDSANGVATLSVEQLHWLIEGIDIAAVQRHPSRNYARVS